MPGKLKTAVVGATGYSGLELTRLLLRHPQVESPLLLSRQGENSAPVNLADLFPVLSGNGGYPLRPLSWSVLKDEGVQLLFLATPHEASRALVPEAVAHGLRVIDLSGAWRLRDATNRAVYAFKDEGSPTAAEFTSKAVYGLPELHGERDSRRLRWWRTQAAMRLRSFWLWRRCLAVGFDRSRARDHFGLEIRGFGSGQRTDISHSFCFRGRQFIRVRGLRPPAYRRNS